MQERGHLASGDDTVGAVHVVDWGVAALGDPSGAELVDVVLEDGVVIVDKQVSASVVDVTDGPTRNAAAWPLVTGSLGQ